MPDHVENTFVSSKRHLCLSGKTRLIPNAEHYNNIQLKINNIKYIR